MEQELKNIKIFEVIEHLKPKKHELVFATGIVNLGCSVLLIAQNLIEGKSIDLTYVGTGITTLSYLVLYKIENPLGQYNKKGKSR